MIYLDSNATTRPAPEVVEAVDRALREGWANPSSVHRAGQAVRHEVELAREEIARLVGCRDREIVFTSGGTEADNLAIFGSLAAQPDRRAIVTSRLEHSAVRETAERLHERGTEVIWIDSTAGGMIAPEALDELLSARERDVALVSIMWANNETGVVQPLEALGRVCREHGVRFHTDAVQWVGKEHTAFESLPIDLLSLSAHKIHGPKGAGALVVRRGVRTEPLILGGPQERERRGGTENVPGILGFAAAARLASAWLLGDERRRLALLRDRFESRLRSALDEVSINGGEADRIWNTSNVGFRRLEAEAILLMLSERGVCASAGAACSSGSLDPSPVLLAMGVPPEYAHGSIRFSLSRETTDDEIDRAAAIVEEVVAKLRASLSAV